MNKELSAFKREIRTVIADHIYSEGCSCCRNDDENERTSKLLAKMLRVKKYKDGSGYDWEFYRTKSAEQ